MAIFISFCLLSFHFFRPNARAQDGAGNTPPAAMSFGYRFENPKFYIPLIELDIAADGQGEVRFKRGESDEMLDRKLKVLPDTLARIRQLMATTEFLTSDEDYQFKKDFSHMGWMTITARAGSRERSARFNYTSNPAMAELSEIFRGIATQEIHLFDLDLAQQFQPLDVPRQLDSLESDLRLSRVTEPEQLLPALRDITDNYGVPLMARNQAGRLVEAIEKKKYKSPIKSK